VFSLRWKWICLHYLDEQATATFFCSHSCWLKSQLHANAEMAQVATACFSLLSSRFKLIRFKPLLCEGQQTIFWIILYHVQPLLCNKRINSGVCDSFIGNGLVNMFPRQGIRTQSYYWKRDFLLGPCQVGIRKTIRATKLVISIQLRVEFCKGGCEDRTWAREAEESSLLEAVARERLMKTQQAGRGLSVCCGYV
jgi:hypothetical protein